MKISMDRWGETLLGAAVAAVAVGFFVFAAAQAGQTGGGDGYHLTARFDRVDGIAVGSDVRVSGVKVGVVRAIAIDPATYLAQLTLGVQEGLDIPVDSTARIASDGLLGGAYVAIEPAGVDPIEPGGEILNTQGAVDLLTLFANMAQPQSEPEGAGP